MMQLPPPPKSRAELNQRLRESRIETRKNFGTYVSLQTQRRIAEAQKRAVAFQFERCGWTIIGAPGAPDFGNEWGNK